MAKKPEPAIEAAGIPVFEEEIGGALLDSARISVMAAMRLLPAPPDVIVLPGDEERPSLHTCLDQAMQWLNAARQITVEMATAAPTSLHVVTSKGKAGG